jgi:hypothetical protein
VTSRRRHRHSPAVAGGGVAHAAVAGAVVAHAAATGAADADAIALKR